jgi:hypothetical protein
LDDAYRQMTFSKIVDYLPNQNAVEVTLQLLKSNKTAVLTI